MNDRTNHFTYYPFFDYLRIVLACVVMLGHDKVITWHASGNLAVQVFFALSGWLIGGILLKTSAADLPRFYMNRALRIWVPYYLALTLLLAASLLKDRIGPKWFEFMFYKAFFVYNIFGTPQIAQHHRLVPLQGTGNHFWSVNAEEQFYLLAPLLLVLAAHKFGRQIALWLIIAFAAWWFDVYASIVLGVLAAVTVNKFGAFHLNRWTRTALYVGFVLTSAGMINGYRYEAIAPIFAVCTVLLLATAGTPHLFGKFLGGMSYPLYLNHWIGVFAGNALLAPFGMRDSALRQAIAAVLNLLVAAVLYWYVDRQVLAQRDRLFSPARGRALMLASYATVAVGLVGGAIYARLG